MSLDRDAVTAGLKAVIGELDYDLAKSLDPDTSETGEDGWPDHVDQFTRSYERALKAIQDA